MKWTNRIKRNDFYKWLAILLVVLLVDGAVDGIGLVGAVPFSWYFGTLISVLVTGLLIVVGIHLFKLKGNRKLTIACFILGAIFMLGSIYTLFTIVQININPNYWFS